MIRYNKNNKFYRVVLLLATLLYISFAYFFNYLLEINDPMTIRQRIFGAGIFFIIFLLSYFNNWIKENLEKVTYFIAFLAIIQMIFINFILDFNFQMAISIIVTVFVFNILFKADKIAIYSNIVLATLTFFSLLFIESFYNFFPGFYLSYLLAAFISLYVSFKRTENEIALIKSEKSYKNLVGQMQLGLAEHEMIYDEDGKPVDFKFLSINDSYEKLTGLISEEVVGKTAIEVLPEMDNNWINEYSKVVLNGETRDFENYSNVFDKTFAVTSYPTEKDRFIVIIDDITKRKRHEVIIKELHNIAGEFKNLDTEEEVCKRTIEAAEKLLAFNICHLSLVKNDRLVPVAASEEMDANPRSINKGVAGKTLIENKSYLINDAHNNPEAEPTEADYKSGLSIPVKNMGVFQAIANKTNAFDQNDLELAEILISHTTSALKRIYAEQSIKDKNIMLSSILESIQDGIAVINPDLTIRYTNKKMREWYSDSITISGRKCYDVFQNSQEACPSCPTLRAMESGKVEREIVSGVEDPKIEYLEIYSYPIRNRELDEVTGVVEFVRDITERINQKKQLEMHKFFVDNADILILRVTPDGEITYANQAMLNKLDYNMDEFQGESVDMIIPEKNYIERNKFWQQIKESGSITYEKNLVTSNGRKFPAEITSQYFNYEDEEYEFVFAADITKEKEKEREIKYLLYRDKLTGLYNRRFFEEELKRLDTERQIPISLIMADINGLKLINDSYGHEEGDRLLNSAANIFIESVRSEDILARWAGDEFVILLPRTNQKEAKIIV